MCANTTWWKHETVVFRLQLRRAPVVVSSVVAQGLTMPGEKTGVSKGGRSREKNAAVLSYCTSFYCNQVCLPSDNSMCSISFTTHPHHVHVRAHRQQKEEHQKEAENIKENLGMYRKKSVGFAQSCDRFLALVVFSAVDGERVPVRTEGGVFGCIWSRAFRKYHYVRLCYYSITWDHRK